MNNNARLFSYLLSVSLGFGTCLPSYPHSLSVFSSQAEPVLCACAGNALCWGGRTSPAAEHSPCVALARSEVPNTETRPEDTVVALLGWLCSESQERAKRSLLYPSQSLTHGSLQGVHAPPGSLVSVARVCALQEVASEHLDPTSQQLHQALCREALSSWSSSHPPQLGLLSWCPWHRRTLTEHRIPLSLLEKQVWDKCHYLERIQCP